ncbi:MAG: phosphatase PAP2 family protein [Synechococcus sp.]
MLPPLLAQTPPPAAEAAAGLVLPADRYAALVGQPPAAGSRGEADDLAILRWLQLSRTAEAASRTWSFLSRSLSRFDAAIGADLNRTAPTLTAGLPSFLRVITTVKDELKTSHARPRPFLAHPDLRPCLPLEDSPAYPSGHALWYAAAGQLLADLLPERRERLLEVGRQGGFARVTCGVHYPSDVLASQRLAAAMAADVIASPQWRAFRERVRDEGLRLQQLPGPDLPALN